MQRMRAQTKYLTNGAYLRVKNLTLGYTIPQSVISKIGINNLRECMFLQKIRLRSIICLRDWIRQLKVKRTDWVIRL